MNQYWCCHGKYQNEANVLIEMLPFQGSTGFLELEFFRAATKIYYDLFNNGFGNNWSEPFLFLSLYAERIGINEDDLYEIKDYAEGKVIQKYNEEDVYEAMEKIVDAVVQYVYARKNNLTKSNVDMWNWRKENI